MIPDWAPLSDFHTPSGLFSIQCLAHADILSTLLSISSVVSLRSSITVSSSYASLASSRMTCMISASRFSWSFLSKNKPYLRRRCGFLVRRHNHHSSYAP
ncbi:unnamed protein product [Tuber aestivum]|uniref:Uncharacterized protein n=1 Tax=Tuber aestivum TaxID=59557 RepID=A0A292PRK0_9PEZI|nr:unnamed protein product [Tuber aestivum]